MAIELNDNISSKSPKILDARYSKNGVTPYTDIADVNSTISLSYRSLGLTVLIGSDEFWYKNGITDLDLIFKESSNKVTTITGNETSTTKFPVVKAIVDYLIATYQTIITYTSWGTFLHAATNKTTPVDADEVGIWDSVSGLFQRVSFTNIKAFLKTYFDAVYQTKYTDVSDNQIITGTSITLPNTPIFIYGVFMNGQRLTITTDYTISGVTITLVNAASSDLFTTVYKY